MLISELLRYLHDNQRAALRDLASHFDIEPEALRGMLELLERRGRVRKLPANTPCAGGCCSCDPASIEIYEWIAAEQN
ncbi:FeoC-like transcriptional regulator [Chromatium okenii]|jgi:predicted ArsR family transcriptional regulator|uniref:Sugar metabolism transcriptional regulator n=1 Tax=Chromatium okenii TaxID=61644 RepID=A0A2S7XMI6_9GAMM|nr:FeoC-like transcriptional regulator [Chromatium okenii]MBV5309501.1 FeoC-like transcriptional regulator [Chromatium okenii]PQJ94957.1 sugar metabolism transcriptional regulator [Chromatium okenii]PQJ96951.1 sugar metabolism transcriptional regulator [Chromatium okenii]